MNLLNILLEIYKDEYDLNLKEGLIKSTEVLKTVDILKRRYRDSILISTVDVYGDNSSNKIYVTFYPGFTAKELDDFIRDANAQGWFPSWIQSVEYNGKYTDKIAKNIIESKKELEIDFEAKYDIKVDVTPKTLYHVTPTNKVDKILKVGLAPKSKEKASAHPERVSVTSNENAAEKLAEPFYKKTGIRFWTILKIDTELIPDYLKFYRDPNYPAYGMYTLNFIPPKAISVVKDIHL